MCATYASFYIPDATARFHVHADNLMKIFVVQRFDRMLVRRFGAHHFLLEIPDTEAIGCGDHLLVSRVVQHGRGDMAVSQSKEGLDVFLIFHLPHFDGSIATEGEQHVVLVIHHERADRRRVPGKADHHVFAVRAPEEKVVLQTYWL
jgi:hypothetical protein